MNIPANICWSSRHYFFEKIWLESSVATNLQFILVNFLHVGCSIWRSNKLEFFVSCNIRLQKHPSFCSLFCYVLSYKTLIVLSQGDNNFPFWHLYQIHTLNNNLNDEEITTCHLMCTGPATLGGQTAMAPSFF